LGCCSDRFINITEFTDAQQQHITINFGRSVNESQQRLSAEHFTVEHFSLGPDT
jgi:hypothetical protein